ncbi:ATP-binding protein [Pseudomonas putida]|uniref:DUF7673 family protein n=1 Tax=Pseudomonas putida TaxID=303 RepID=UPI00034EDB7C|nr:ATP-binding protein [Pseudomonas putida]AGN81294.1 hypothetical protein L483_01190 [Pseudomonas putida H8234]HDS1810201.1 ATP-binding protein [Pseudomonas putida]HDS3807044.1 ATP-binding protein [Pseudomonas putida]
MQLKVINGPAGSGKTTKLRKLAEEKGLENHILVAQQMTAEALKRAVHKLVLRGAKDLFIDECPQGLLDEIVEIVVDMPRSMRITLHAVVEAPPQATSDRVVFDDFFSYQDERPAIREAGIQALARLVPVALRESGQSRTVGRFLLGLYNGHEFPFTLTDLRSLDVGLFDDCIAVLRLDNVPELEVHEYLPKGNLIFNQLREYWA